MSYVKPPIGLTGMRMTGSTGIGQGADTPLGTSIKSEGQVLPNESAGDGASPLVGSDRPLMKSNPIFRHEVGASGGSYSEFLGQIRDCMMKNDVSAFTTNRSLEKACRECGVSLGKVDVSHLEQLIPAIEKAARVMVEDDTLANAMGELRLLGHDAAAANASVDATPDDGIVDETTHEDGLSINIGSENDALNARSAALDFALDVVELEHKAAGDVAKVVVELSRNIYKYAELGNIELISLGDGIKIVASDSGPGIPNLEEVLSEGEGLTVRGGADLLMCSKLMDGFEVKTGDGSKGTTVIKVKDGFEVKTGNGRSGTTVTAIKLR